MYHPTIQLLDQAASHFHQMGDLQSKNGCFRLAGQLQQKLLSQSPYPKNRRFLDKQWVWATGHIGLLYQLIRWFKLHEPETELVLVTQGASNPHFLKHLLPFLTVIPVLAKELQDEALYNSVYFGCPDGKNDLVRFNKLIELDCKDINLLQLSGSEEIEAEILLAQLGVKRPYVAFQARRMKDDPLRNVSSDSINTALSGFLARGFGVVSTGLDVHPINEIYPSVLKLADPLKASFLLNANCDQFIGSNSGAWTIAHSFRKPVQIIGDLERSAWIYS